MNRLQYEMSVAVDELCFRACIATPEDKYEMLALGVECADSGIGKGLPSSPLVTGRLVCPHRECGVE